MRTYRHRLDHNTAVLVSCRTHKGKKDDRQTMLYTLRYPNGHTTTITGQQLRNAWDWQHIGRPSRDPRRYTSTRGQRRREQLGRK